MHCINPVPPPPITAYQQIALPLTVAMINPSAVKWFYSNYIQASCVNRQHYLRAFQKDNYLHYSFYNPEITFPAPADHMCIDGNKQSFLLERLSFIEWALSEGWYLYTDADMFYIEGSDSFGKAHYSHDLLIHGVTDGQLFVYMYDKTALSEHVVGYDNFKKGYYSDRCYEDDTPYRNRLILFRPNEKTFDFDVSRIKWHMHDYLSGTETFARERPNVFNPDSLCAYGIDTYAQLNELFNFALGNEDKDLRNADLYCFFEHKKVMFDRVNLLREESVLSADNDLVAGFERVMKDAQTLMMLGLKLSRTRGNDRKNMILLHMKDLAEVIRNNEENVWYEYIDANREQLG